MVENCQMVLAIDCFMTSSQRVGRPLRVALVVARDDLVLEQPIQVLRVGPVLRLLVGVCLRVRRSPSRCQVPL